MKGKDLAVYPYLFVSWALDKYYCIYFTLFHVCRHHRTAKQPEMYSGTELQLCKHSRRKSFQAFV